MQLFTYFAIAPHNHKSLPAFFSNALVLGKDDVNLLQNNTEHRTSSTKYNLVDCSFSVEAVTVLVWAAVGVLG